MAIRSLKSGSFSRSTQVGNSIILPGDYESIATQVVGSGGASSITFNSIPSTFTHLQVRGIAQEGGAQIQLNINSDTGTNYAYHHINGNGTSVVAQASTSTTYILNNFIEATSASYPLPIIIDILDYANTNKYKTVRTLAGIDKNGSGAIQLVSGLWMNTNAITSLTIKDNAGNLGQYSHFALYGIRG